MSTRLIGRRREGGCVHAAWPVSVPRARAQLPWLVEQKSGQRGSSALHLELLVRGSCGPHNRLGKASTLGPFLPHTATERSVPQVQRQDTLALAGTATAREWRDKPEAAERVLEGPLGSGAPDGTAFCVRVA